MLVSYDFALRSPAIQKPFQTTCATSVVTCVAPPISGRFAKYGTFVSAYTKPYIPLLCERSAPPIYRRFAKNYNAPLYPHKACCSVLWCESSAPPISGPFVKKGTLRLCSHKASCSVLWCTFSAPPIFDCWTKKGNFGICSHKICSSVL